MQVQLDDIAGGKRLLRQVGKEELVDDARTRNAHRAFLFPTGHKREACYIGEYGSGPILAVKPEQRARGFELIGGEIATNGRKPLAQFLSVPSVPSVANRAEPLVAVRLADRGPCANHLPALAASVARGAHIIQSAESWREIVGLG